MMSPDGSCILLRPSYQCLYTSSVVGYCTDDSWLVGWLVEWLVAMMDQFWCRRLTLVEVDTIICNSGEEFILAR